MKKISISLIAIILLLSCSVSHKISRPGSPTQPVSANPAKDTSKSVLKPYKEVITKDAVTDKGLFTIHKIGDKYFFEIPDAILEKDILIVNRISKGKYDGVASTFGGDQAGETMVRFSKSANNKFFIRQRAQDIRAADSSANGMFAAVANTNLQPIIASFDIKAISPDSSGVVLDVTSYLNGDNELISIDNRVKRFISFGLGAYLADRSYINSVHSYPQNVEIKTVKTYVRANNGGSFTVGNATFELNCSIVLLPDESMKARFKDDRIGYFTTGYYNFEADKPVDINWMIKRWRLEPREEDREKYKRGELVEPKKPVIFYIDPATPKKWAPYLKQGVADWQKAFEKAGFKNAIYALDAPADDSTWSIDDSRHNVIVYKSSIAANASGPQIIDPRSGEVLESHVNWYHNVQQILHDWYMIQAGPNDPGADKMQYDEELMGRLIRYVCTHEIGHTLGLQHNFGSSSTMPVDSLRSKNYIRANSFCPSIMDYARFNYVAQPGDSLEREDLIPRIGVYDEWAIEWGYRLLPDFHTGDEEKTYLNKWVIDRIKNDKRLWFGSQTNSDGSNLDPRRQDQDLGDDAVKAGKYGIANLKRVIAHLKEWTRVPNENYESLARMYNQVNTQYRLYLLHVLTNIGGLQWSDKTVEQEGYTLSFPSKAVQKAAVQFLQEELFVRPSWIMDEDIYKLTAGGFSADAGTSNLILYDFGLNQTVFNRVLNYTTYYNLMLAQSLDPEQAYPVDELLRDFETGIWKELAARSPITEYRRGVQKSYIARLIAQLDPEKIKAQPFDKRYAEYMSNTDVQAVIKAHLKNMLVKINAAIPVYHEIVTKDHLMEIRDRIKKALYGKKEEQATAAAKTIGSVSTSGLLGQEEEFSVDEFKKQPGGCFLPCKNARLNLIGWDSKFKKQPGGCFFLYKNDLQYNSWKSIQQ